MATAFEPRAADPAEAFAADGLPVQRAGDVEEIVERADIVGDDHPSVAYAESNNAELARNRRGMAHDAADSRAQSCPPCKPRRSCR